MIGPKENTVYYCTHVNKCVYFRDFYNGYFIVYFMFEDLEHPISKAFNSNYTKSILFHGRYIKKSKEEAKILKQHYVEIKSQEAIELLKVIEAKL